jgi:cystathionine beta-lyase/cystathionine gamma-synthase
MDSGGPLVAAEVAGGLEGGRRFAESVTIPMLAPSLGGPETLISHPASMTHVDLSPDDRRDAGITDGLLRISVGLEHPDDLVTDVLTALDAVAAG